MHNKLLAWIFAALTLIAASPTFAAGGYVGSVPANHIDVTQPPYNMKAAPIGTTTYQTANDTAIAAAELQAETTHYPLYIPAPKSATDCYKVTGGSTVINADVDWWGDGFIPNFDGSNTDAPMNTPNVAGGSILCPTVNGSAAITISGGHHVNFHHLAINFGNSFNGTGDGIDYIATGIGLQTSIWEDLYVFGVDGTHYAYNLQNFEDDDFYNLKAVGGGCIKLKENHATLTFGNATFYNSFCVQVAGDATTPASCYQIDATHSAGLHFLTFVRPKCNQADYYSLLTHAVQSGDYLFKQDTNSTYVKFVAPDFETNFSNKIRLGSSDVGNDYDFSGTFTGSAFEAPTWNQFGIFGPSQNLTITNYNLSGTAGAIQAAWAFPAPTFKCSSACTEGIATLYVEAPIAGTNVTTSGVGQRGIWCTSGCEIYADADLSANNGLFINGGTIQLGTGLANCTNAFKTTSSGTISCVTPAATQSSSAAPTAPASTSAFKMQGLAGSITPTHSGTVTITISGTIQNAVTTVNSGIKIQISHGTGTAPSNAGTLAGTQDGQIQTYTLSVAATAAADVNTPFSITALVTGLTVGTAYWIDLAAESVTTTSSGKLAAVNIVAVEE